MPRPRELPDRARVVIIGGGVGGTSIAYHLAELGERDVAAARPRRADERLDVPLRGARRPAARQRLADADDDVQRRALPAPARRVRATTRAGRSAAASAWPARPSASRRRAARSRWAKTFGLPLELISPDEARELFPLMITDGVRVASFLPTDGYLDPSQLTYALADGARRGGVQICDALARDGDRRRAAARCAASAPSGATSSARSLVNAGGMYAAEIGRMAGVRVPIVPMAHEYLVSQPFDAMREARAARGHLPTLRDPDLLVYYREEGDGIVMGGYERDCAPWSLDERLVDRIPADFNGRLLEEEWDRFAEITENSRRRVPGDGSADRDAADQRARGVHARQRVLPRRDRGRAASSSPPGSARTGWPARAASARSWPSGSTAASRRWTSGRWTCVASGRSTARRATRSRARRRSTRPTTTSSTRATSARPVGRCASRAPTAGTPSTARRSARSPAGSASTGTSRTPPPATSRCARDGWAGHALVARDRRRAPSRRASAPACSTSPRSPSSRSRARARRRSSSGSATTTSHATSGGHLHADAQRARRDRVRLHRRAARGGALPDRHRHGVRPARRGLAAAATRRATAACEIADTTARWACFALWGPRARDILRAADAGSLARGLPVHDACASITRRRRAGARAARDVRRRARLGALLPVRVRRGAVARRCGRPGASTGSSPAATGRSTRCAWRRATASGPRTSRPTTRPYEARPRLLRQARQAGGFIGREALRGRARSAARAAARLPRARGPARGRARQRAGARRRRDRGPRDERRLRLQRRALDRLRVRAGRRADAGDGGRDRHLRPLGRGRGRAEPLWDPAGERVRG